MNPNISISIDDVSKSFKVYQNRKDRLAEVFFLGKRKYHETFWALRNISFTVKKGSCFGIIGRNGAGKSTLLQIIAGTLLPNDGSLKIKGRVSALLELGSGFHPDFTGRENIFMNASILGLSRIEIEKKYDEITEFADIGNFIEQPVKTYSSGMYLRLAFAVSINVEPDILLIDEALAVGDILFQAKCFDKLNELKNRGTTIIFVSHDMNTIKRLCTDVAYLDRGVIRCIGKPRDIIEAYYLNIRAEQQKESEAYSNITQKRPLKSTDNLAFGTDQGRIVKAEFEHTKSGKATFKIGDTMRVNIEAEFNPEIKNPGVSIVIQDRKSIDLGGSFAHLGKKVWQNGVFHSEISFSLRVSLNIGEYFITARLEDRTSAISFFPIDKQVGALRFYVLPDENKNLLGTFDFQIKHEEVMRIATNGI